MIKHSSISIDTGFFRPNEGEFHAHPLAEKQPIQRPRVRMPNQKMTPPLIKWAKPLNTCLPCYFQLERTRQNVPGTYEDSSHGHNASANFNEAKNKEESKGYIVGSIYHLDDQMWF